MRCTMHTHTHIHTHTHTHTLSLSLTHTHMHTHAHTCTHTHTMNSLRVFVADRTWVDISLSAARPALMLKSSITMYGSSVCV